ncbi:MAG TPA: hypothetical protein VM925_05395, partial [Labilithrix sp.]|nr:hypothetical protein [Labilithrix sp.]
RATLLAYLLERPPGLDIERLIEELTSFLLGYVLGPGASARDDSAARAVRHDRATRGRRTALAR